MIGWRYDCFRMIHRQNHYNYQMQFKEQIEYIVNFKLFQSIKFWFKGEYGLRIGIYEDGNATQSLRWAYPKLIKHPKNQMRQQFGQKSRKTIFQNEGHYYQSQIFNVYYESEQFEINDSCSFKMQQPTIRLRTQKPVTKMLVQLFRYKRKSNSQRKKHARSKSKSKSKTKKGKQTSYGSHLLLSQKVQPHPGQQKQFVKVAQKTLILKRSSSKELDQFYCCLLNETKYFGMVYLYVGSVHLGFKLRKRQMQLSQFTVLPAAQQKQLSISQENKVGQYKQANKKVKNFMGEDKLRDFYRSTVTVAKNSYKLLRRKIRRIDKNKGKYSLRKYYPQMHLQFEPTPEQKDFDLFIMKKYEINDPKDGFFEAFKESYAIFQYTKSMLSHFEEAISTIQKSAFLEHCSQTYSEYFKTLYDVCIYHQFIEHKVNERQMFLSKKKQYIDSVGITDVSLLEWPLISLEKQPQKPLIKPEKKGTSMVVFVHGYLGNHLDFQKAASYLESNGDNFTVLVIKNINTKNHTLENMGRHVAEQIKRQILMYSLNVDKLNFIGYSLGGIIIRAALEHLEPFKDKLNLFISFASPHLGTSICENNFVKLGVCFISRVQKVRALDQINNETIYLENLCNHKGISWFKKIVLIGSQEDDMVPFSSAVVLPDLIEDEEVKQNAINFIALANKIQRLKVWFNDEERAKTYEKIIGQRSHLQFIVNDIFLQLIFRLYVLQL